MTPFRYLYYLIKYRSNPLHIAYIDGKKTLDVGCGEGEFIKKDPHKRIGVDIDQKLVSRCLEQGLVAHCMSATNLSFPDQCFDAVHAAELIEHLDPPTAVRFLAESARVLKPGGIVYITTPGEHYVWNTFSHIKPYPPMAFHKLLGSSTEGFIQDQTLSLKLERYYAFGVSSRTRIVTGLRRAINIAFRPHRPSGYVIILRKPLGNVSEESRS